MVDTCTHEAGHAVMAWYFRLKLGKVSALAGADYLGTVQHVNPLYGIKDDPSAEAIDNGELDALACHKYVLIALAGAEASRVVELRRPKEGARDDDERAFDVCLRVSRSESEARAMMRWLRLRAFGILSTKLVKPSLVALANRLLVTQTLEGDEALKVICDAGA